MPDAPAPTSDVAAHVGSGLTKKLGPLPIWGWVLVGGGVIVVGYLAYNAYQNAQGNTSSTPSLGDLSSLLGGSGTPAGTLATTPTTTTTTPLTNAAWVQPLIAQVAAATGYSSQEVQLYLDEYLAGYQPVGLPGGTNAFQTIVNSALGLGGAPPQTVPIANLNTNYFTNTQSYFNELLTFLPSGTSQSIITELQNLFNGTTTIISSGAATALSQAQSVVGQGPNPINYSIFTPITTVIASGQIPGLLSSIWNQYGFEQTSNSPAFAQGWINQFQSTLGVPAGVATAAWNAIQANPNSYVSQLGYVSSTTASANIAALLNSLIAQYNANPGSFSNIPTSAINLGVKNPNPLPAVITTEPAR